MNKRNTLLPTLVVDSRFYSEAKLNYEERFLLVSTDDLLEPDATPQECARWFSTACPSGKVLLVTRPTAGRDALLKSHAHRASWDGEIRAMDVRSADEIKDLLSPEYAEKWRVVTEKFKPTLRVGEEWPPLPKQKLGDKAADFPLFCLPEPARGFVEEISRAICCDPAMASMGVLAAMAGAVGGSSTLQIAPGWRENASLWLAIVANAGSAKSPVLQACLRPIWGIQSELSSRYKKALKEYHDSREIAKATKTVENYEKPAPEFIVVGDATSEALVSILANSPRGVLQASDELLSWVRGCGQYKGGKGNDRESFLSLWSSQPVSVHRKTGQDCLVSVKRPIYSLVGGLVNDRINELSTGVADGLAERILFSKPATIERRFNPNGISQGITDEYQRFIQTLWEIEPEGSEPRVVHLSEDAREIFGEFYNRVLAMAQADDLPPMLRGSYSKMPSQVARLGIILHQGRLVAKEESDPHRLSPDTMDAACLLAKYFMGQGRGVAAGLDRGLTRVQMVQERILSWIRRHKNQIFVKDGGTAKWRNLRHDLRSSISHGSGMPDDRLFGEALQALESQGYVKLRYEFQTENLARRPLIDCNPELYSGE